MKIGRSEVCFHYNPDAELQVPHILDVLFVLGISDVDEAYTRSRNEGSNELYVINTHRAAVTASFDIWSNWGWGREWAVVNRIIARAIVDLCPDGAGCLFNSTFANAKRLSGDELPPLSVGKDELHRWCFCRECRKIVHDENDLERLHTD